MASIIKDTRHLQGLQDQQNQKKTQDKNEKKSAAQQVIDLEASPSSESSILKKLVDTAEESSKIKKRAPNTRQRKQSSSSDSSARSRSSSPEIISTVSSRKTSKSCSKKTHSVEPKRTPAQNSNKLPLPRRSDVIITNNTHKTINSQTYITPVASATAASTSFSSPTFLNAQMQSQFQIYTPSKADSILTNRNLNLNSQAFLIQPQVVNKSGQGLMQMQQSQPPIFLPANFNGTILIQPTIHIHGNTKLNNIISSKYRQIIPKGGSQNNANKKK
jgi:hypothetical protein